MNTLCYMLLHCQTRLLSSIVRQFNHWFLVVGLFPKACTLFERLWTWALNIYVYVGISFIGWFNHQHTLLHDFTLPDTSSKQYGQAPQPLVFGCCLLNQGLHPFWKALNIDPKHIYVHVGTSFIGWFNHEHTLLHDFTLPDTSSKQYGQAPQPWVFGCWLVSQGLHPF